MIVCITLSHSVASGFAAILACSHLRTSRCIVIMVFKYTASIRHIRESVLTKIYIGDAFEVKQAVGLKGSERDRF